MDFCDGDVAMSDAEPYYPDLHHIRTDSSVSSVSSASISPMIGTRTSSLVLEWFMHSYCLATHAAFDLYPFPLFSDESFVTTDSPNDSHYTPHQMKVGLLQPSLKHHG